ncbi:MAG: exodeoxyribonuclease VII large subunit, partial [Myxococcales bacterium]|nr:exodeoxyribonuclease VII large subunit [Myxococcales bacterium]
MAQRQYNLFNGRSPPGRRGGGGDDGPHVFTVSRLVRAAHSALEQQFSRILVEGEISNLRIVGSGHAYFTLKDDAASLPVALWRSTLSRLRFRLHDGLALRVGGRLGIYPAQGKFQLYAEHAEPAGLGSLMQQLERLKAALYAEGLFDPAR